MKKEESRREEKKTDKKVIFEQPLGKILIPIAAFYGLIVTILAFTYDKNLYYFLNKSKIIVIVDCFLVIFLLITAIIKFLDEKQPSFIVGYFERASLSIFVIIISFLFMSFINNSVLSNKIENKILVIIGFVLIQIVFGNSIVISNFTLMLNIYSINFYRREEHILFIRKIREWFLNKNKIIIFFISFIHSSTVIILYVIFIGTETVKIAIDWIFFIELILPYMILSMVFAIMNYQFENELKKKQIHE